MSNELGTLVIVVLKARNLNDKHSFFKQDVFAQVSLNGITQRTAVDVKGGQHPEWDAEFRFPVMRQSQDKHRKLEVACFSKESKSDDLLGRGTVDITETMKTLEFDEWVPLNVDGVVRGDLYLEMTFFPNTPLPTTSLAPPSTNIDRRPSKLAPSERLSRPKDPTPLNVLQDLLNDDTKKPHERKSNAAHTLVSQQRLASSSRTPSPHTKYSDLPPLPPPEGVKPAPLPSTLLPGGGRARPHQNPASHVAPHLPSSLRSGPEKPVASHPIASSHGGRYPLASPLPHNQRLTPNSSPVRTPNPTPPAGHTGYPSNTGTIPGPSYTPLLPDNLPPPWVGGGNISGPISFPVPTVAPPPSNADYRPNITAPESYSPPVQLPVLQDPYLQARYSSPLPLPPSSSSPSHGQGQGHGPSSPHNAPQYVPTERLRQLEEEAKLKQRKEQEERDLALAMQLDRQLNLS